MPPQLFTPFTMRGQTVKNRVAISPMSQYRSIDGCANDWHMGTRIFSRELHDLVFGLYGKMLGMDPKELPGLLAKAVAFDSLIVLAIVAFRMRKKWWPAVSNLMRPEIPVTAPGSPAE